MSHRALRLMSAIGVAILVGGCWSEATDKATDGGDTDTDNETDTDSDSDVDPETDPDPDADNDGDGLSNGEEEELGTDLNDPDSDDDGINDFVEWVAGTDPNDPDSNPAAEGDFYFFSPYGDMPWPESAVLVFTAGEAAAELAASPRDDESDEEDAAVLLERISPNTVGGIEDPLNQGLFCAGGLATADDDSDSIPDRFVDVPAGTTVCFDVIPAMNETIPEYSIPTVWKAFIDIVGDGETVLDTREAFFLINGPIGLP